MFLPVIAPSDAETKRFDPRAFDLNRLSSVFLLSRAVADALRGLDTILGPDSLGYKVLQLRKEGIRETLSDMDRALKNNSVASAFSEAVRSANGEWIADPLSFNNVAVALYELCNACTTWLEDPEAPLPSPFPHRALNEGLFLLGVTAILVHRTDLLSEQSRDRVFQVPIEQVETILGFAGRRDPRDFPRSMMIPVNPDRPHNLSPIVTERYQLTYATIKLGNFLGERLLSKQYHISALDPDFIDLLNSAGGHTAHIIQLPGTSGSLRASIVYDPTAAKDVVKILGAAGDLLFVRVDTWKSLREVGPHQALSQVEAPFGSLRLAKRPTSPGDHLIHLDASGHLAIAGNRLPVIGEHVHSLRVHEDGVQARERAALESSGVITPLDMLLIQLHGALEQVEAISQGSAPLAQNGQPVPPTLLRDLNRKVAHFLPQDARATPSHAPASVASVTRYLGSVVDSAIKLLEGAKPGGCLSAGYAGGLDHQIPIGVDPLAIVANEIAAAYNGAHIEATHFPDLEDRLDTYVRHTSVLFPKPWTKGKAVTTAGGTMSNKLSAKLAFASAGGGLALKRAAHELGIDIEIVDQHGQSLLADLSDDRALMLHPSVLSDSLSRLSRDEVAKLQPLYKAGVSSLHSERPPLVVFPGGEWVHYTLEGDFVDHPNKTIARIPLTAELELDFDAVKAEVERHYVNGVVPLIIPLTFCNTGLGRTGFAAEALREFNGWFESQYGSLPIYIVDAAQGGLTYGFSERELSPSVVAAHKAIGEVAIGLTLDPHKAYLPVPGSLWVVRDSGWAVFATSRSIGHNYLTVGDSSVLREAAMLSAPLQTAFFDLLFLMGLEDGRHRQVVGPALDAANRAFITLNRELVSVTVDGAKYRLLAPFSPHSGILGVCFVPLDGDHSMARANGALKEVREYLSGDRTTPISCSGYKLGFDALAPSALTRIQDEFIHPDLDWRDVETFEFLRFVFRQGGQDVTVTRDLPALIEERFSVRTRN